MDTSKLSLDELNKDSGGVDLNEIKESLGEGEYGPAVAGRTPLIGEVRRQNGMPVLRDELKDRV